MSSFPPPPLGPPPLVQVPAGWYADPWMPGGWRWWDGRMWTQFASSPLQAAAQKPMLPRWLSVPVVVCAPLVVLGLIIALFIRPLAILGASVPILFVWPVARVVDRVEPEPISSRVHAVLWGATVAVTVSVILEVLMGLILSSQAAAGTLVAVVGAPVIEEAAKGLGLLWVLRRKEIDGTSDGVVYAALIALGFAVVEDVIYLGGAGSGSLLFVFVLRSLLSPFAHPLFTMWTGLAVGRQVRRGLPLLPGALGGYALAVAAHMAWNGSAVFAAKSGDNAVFVIIGVVALFVLLFFAVMLALVRSGRRERARFVAQAPAVAHRLGLTPAEQIDFSSWALILHRRSSLPRSKRRAFDDYHAAIARLTVLYERQGTVDPTTERVLAEQVREAREKLAS